MGRTAVAGLKNMFLKGVGTGWNHACLFFAGYIAETFFGSRKPAQNFSIVFLSCLGFVCALC